MFEVVVFIVLSNALAFGSLIAAVKFQELKEAREIAKRNAELVHAYRVRYGAKGVEY